MMSPRFARALCLVLAVPLVPTVIHTYAGLEATDGRRVEAAGQPVAGFDVTTTRRGPSWGSQNFKTDDWLERRYRSTDDDIVVTVVRSYDAKTLYHHPELACAYGTPFDQYTVERFPPRGELPVHVLRASRSRAAAFYALHYDEGFVEHPLRFQLQQAGTLLFSARHPMTLFFVHDPNIGAATELGAVKAVSLLYDVIDRFIASAPRDGIQ